MAMTLADMIKTLFDVKTNVIHRQVTVPAVAPACIIAPNNPNRLSLLVSNPWTRNVYVKFDVNVAVDEGILLVPNGGFVAFLWDEDFDIVGWELRGISMTAATKVNVIEIVSV